MTGSRIRLDQHAAFEYLEQQSSLYNRVLKKLQEEGGQVSLCPLCISPLFLSMSLFLPLSLLDLPLAPLLLGATTELIKHHAERDLDRTVSSPL